MSFSSNLINNSYIFIFSKYATELATQYGIEGKTAQCGLTHLWLQIFNKYFYSK